MEPLPAQGRPGGTRGFGGGRRRPVFGYSNSATPFAERSRRHLEAVPDPIFGLSTEGFGLPDNLMIPGAVQEGGRRSAPG